MRKKVIIFVLFVISECNCGLIDGILSSAHDVHKTVHGAVLGGISQAFNFNVHGQFGVNQQKPNHGQRPGGYPQQQPNYEGQDRYPPNYNGHRPPNGQFIPSERPHNNGNSYGHNHGHHQQNDYNQNVPNHNGYYPNQIHGGQQDFGNNHHRPNHGHNNNNYNEQRPGHHNHNNGYENNFNGQSGYENQNNYNNQEYGQNNGGHQNNFDKPRPGHQDNNHETNYNQNNQHHNLNDGLNQQNHEDNNVYNGNDFNKPHLHTETTTPGQGNWFTQSQDKNDQNGNNFNNIDKTTKKPDEPLFVPLNPNEYIYGGDKINVTAPKRDTNEKPKPAEDDDEYAIDIRFKDE